MLRIATEFGLMDALKFDAVEVNWLAQSGDEPEDLVVVMDPRCADAIAVQLHAAEAGGVVTAFTAFFDASEPGEAAQMLAAAEQVAVQTGDALVAANPALSLMAVLGEPLFRKLDQPHLALQSL